MNALLRALLLVLLFMPKLDLLAVPGFSVAIKFEDFIWAIIAFFAVFHRNRLKRPVTLVFFSLISYLTFTALYAPSNLLLAARFFFYSIPILIYFNEKKDDVDFYCGCAKLFARVFSIVAILQTTTSFIYVHSGSFYIGQVDRASGIFGNGVEFALVAFMLFWFLRLNGRLSVVDSFCLAVIGFLSGSRLAFAAIVCSLIVVSVQRKFFPLAIAFIVGASTAMLSEIDAPTDESRFASVDVEEIIGAASFVISNIQAKELQPHQIQNYCFLFDDGLSVDKSFAMRLSKLQFVSEYVVLGGHPYGFGMGKCIGDAGDNLFVRILSDGGYPYFFFVLLFFFALFRVRSKIRSDFEWKSFILIFGGVSIFYDTLYFSRVAPLLFFIIYFSSYRRDYKSIPS